MLGFSAVSTLKIAILLAIRVEKVQWRGVLVFLGEQVPPSATRNRRKTGNRATRFRSM